MLLIHCLPKILRFVAIALSLAFILPVTEALALPSETAEIVFTGSDAQPLIDKSAQLGNAVAIYEYVHNQFEFSPYHGSRSGSINTFMGQRGSDVDIATAMIAMLRSQNIPARYAVGTVFLPADRFTNWLGVGNLDVAPYTLVDQGIQGVVYSADRSSVGFEHVWVEALVPFDQYRGLPTPTSVDCSQSANASHCTWIPLDGSFKEKTYNGLNLDPYNAVSFDYAGYYNAIKDSGTDPLQRKDKNPLTILEEQIATWLRANHPGKTLEDIADEGQIIEIHDGLLPASLPYTVTGEIRRYDSVALHDAAVPATEPKKWGKSLTINVVLPSFPSIKAGNILLAQLNTKRLTLTTEIPSNGNGNVPEIVVRLGGTEIARPLTNLTPSIGQPYTITITMDGAPDNSGGTNDGTITASFNAIVGGYYLIATGGEPSNWSQVHRAADQLLADNANYKIVFNPADPGSNGLRCDFASGMNCTPYVDANNNGWDAVDLALLQNKSALDALTGGLLYVAATQYYAKLREQFERAGYLMKVKAPSIGYLGVVSSVYEAEYIDGTAFSVLPGGLLIDMHVMSGGNYRSHETPLTYSNREFEFTNHIGSSLEHETWQELTGYDAVSTVRGIQMALAGGASLVNVKRDATTNTLPAFLNSVGFGAAAPSPFGLMARSIYGTAPNSWSHPGTDLSDGFDMIKKIPSGPTDPRLPWLSYYNDFWDEKLGCFDSNESRLNNLKAQYGGSAAIAAEDNVCGVTWGAGTSIDGAITILQNGYDSYRGGANASLFNYLDAAQGFINTDFLYRSKTLANNSYSTKTVASIRNDLLLRDTGQSWVDIPCHQPWSQAPATVSRSISAGAM